MAPSWTSARSRRSLVLLVLGVSVSISFFYYTFEVMSENPKPIKETEVVDNTPKPPLYEHIIEETARLPQHSPDIPQAQLQKQKYFMLENQIWGVGFNNVLQEVLLDCHLAYLSGRTYVFQPYTWSYDGNYTQKHGRLSASVVPLRAYINGPAAGGPWPAGDPAPRSVSRAYWEKICSPEQRFVLNGTEEIARMGFIKEVTPTQVVLEKWTERLRSIQERCVMLHGWTAPIFGMDEIGGAVIHSIWPKYQHSPVLRGFEWSPIVIGAVNKNLHRLIQTDNPPREGNTTIPGLLAMHIRRGDYYEHCRGMAYGSAPFWGMNRLPSFPDRFTPPQWPSPLKDTRENKDIHHDHCLPSLAGIVRRVELISRDYPPGTIKKIFVLTNTDKKFLGTLKESLADSGWNDVVTSKDLELNWEEEGVDGFVDMELAMRAEIFLGNGFSSLTTNINILRIARGMSYAYSRFY